MQESQVSFEMPWFEVLFFNREDHQLPPPPKPFTPRVFSEPIEGTVYTWAFLGFTKAQAEHIGNAHLFVTEVFPSFLILLPTRK